MATQTTISDLMKSDPAFPQEIKIGKEQWSSIGISRREYIASKILPSLIGSEHYGSAALKMSKELQLEPAVIYVRVAFEIADEFIKQSKP